MPDVWSNNPAKLRNMLTHGGFDCGKEPRILKPRDPYWTCHINWPEYYGDVYIHHTKEFFLGPLVVAPLGLALVLGIVIGYLIGKNLFSRRPAC
jgi:hypothetical protein